MGRRPGRPALVTVHALVSVAVLAAWCLAGVARASEWAGTATFVEPSRAMDAGDVPLDLALAGVTPAPFALETDLSKPKDKGKDKAPEPDKEKSAGPPVLNPYRARVLLQSLTVPGWGQATLGHKTAAIAFFTAEVAIWTTYTAFRVQERMRRDSYERTAQVLAGIDLSHRDEEYRRLVGSYISSEEYNQLVVYRDAANLYYDDPVQYTRYIEEHVLTGNGTWKWQDEGSLLRYSGQRKDAQRAGLRANTALAAAVINRLLSAVHAARASAQHAPPSAWRLEVVPTDDRDASALRLGVRRQF